MNVELSPAHSQSRQLTLLLVPRRAWLPCHLRNFAFRLLMPAARASPQIRSRVRQSGRQKTRAAYQRLSKRMHITVHKSVSHIKRKKHLLLHGPVVDIIERIAVGLEHLPEQLAAVVVVGSLVELEVTAVAKQSPELGRQSFAELSHRNVLLLQTDLVIFILLVCCLQTLPRQLSAEEVEEHICEALEVISATLLQSQVCVDRSVASSACSREFRNTRSAAHRDARA